MKKNLVQDVVPPKKTIRNIDVPERREVKDEAKKTSKYSPKEDPFVRPVSINTKPVVEKTDDPIRIEPVLRNTTPVSPPPTTPPVEEFKYHYTEPKKSKRGMLYFGIFLVILAGAFGVSTYFRSAEIKVTPKTEKKLINENFTAKKDGATNSLSYQLVTVSKDVEKIMDPNDLTSEQRVNRNARGTIVIYNNFGPEPQKLVATTRFQTPEGLVYRLVEPVTIPGTTTKDGKVTAGSIEAVVQADKPGEQYNIGLKDFTVPGLKSDPAKYKAIYARSKTEMSGGFSGMQKTVTKDTLVKTEAQMEVSLQEALSRDVVTQIPSDYILYKNTLTYKYEPAVTVTSVNGSTIVRKKGVATAVIFERGLLTRTILSKTIPDAGENLIKITNLDDLQFSLSSSTPIFNSSNTINFLINGEADLVWVFDENKLKTDLLGLSKKNVNTILARYPGIKEASIITKPFWNGSIPNDPNNVTVTNTLTN